MSFMHIFLSLKKYSKNLNNVVNQLFSRNNLIKCIKQEISYTLDEHEYEYEYKF
jgi:hypothetical protein